MSKSNRSIPLACIDAEAASAEPQLQCSCAEQERTRKKLSRLPVGESVRIIEGAFLAALYHKSRFEIRFLGRQDPTCANNFEIWKSRFQHA